MKMRKSFVDYLIETFSFFCLGLGGFLGLFGFALLFVLGIGVMIDGTWMFSPLWPILMCGASAPLISWGRYRLGL